MSALQTLKENENKKPAKRYTNCNVQAVARTIGTKINFKMPVENLSATGMLLSWAEKERVPFSVNTILELEVSATGPTGQNVQCLAKVIHAGTQEDGRRRFGVKIIQTEDEEYTAWQSIISHIEAQAV